MTCIAWDGYTLSADTGGWDSDGIRLRVKCKVREVIVPKRGLCIIGFAGQVSFADKVADALAIGEWPDPDEHGISRDTIVALAVPYGRRRGFIIESTGTWSPLEEKRWAIGSGRHLAIGALMAGACSRRAVEIAREYTDNAAFTIHTFRTMREGA